MKYVLHEDVRIHQERASKTSKPMAEFHILEDWEKILTKAVDLTEEFCVDCHGMGCDVIRFLLPRFGVMDEYRLKGAEEGVVRGDKGIRTPYYGMFPPLKGLKRNCNGMFLNDTVGIDEEEDIAPAVLRPHIPGSRSPGASVQPDKGAGELLYDFYGIVC